MREGRIEVRARTLAIALGAALLTGLGMSGLWSSSRGSAPDAPAPSRHVGVAARSRVGATAAAARYVQLGQQLFDRSPTERRRLLRAIAARAAADGFIDAQARQLGELDAIAARGSGRLTWQVAVLATRIDAYTPTRARVALWRVGILNVGGLVAPLSEWGTVTYELVWERGAWRVWSETDAPGPTPMGHPEEHPSAPRDLRSQLRGFTRYPDGGSL